MIIRPVYLLPPEQPEPDRRVKLSRRAFFAASASVFSVGTGVGLLAERHLLAHPQSETAGGRPRPPESRSLRQARALATGPFEELYDHCFEFLRSFDQQPNDEVLRQGITRLVEGILSDAQLAGRPLRARVLRQLGARTQPLLISPEQMNELRQLSNR